MILLASIDGENKRANDNDRYVLAAQPGQVAGAAKKDKPALKAHRPKRPARLRSPQKAPVPDRPTVGSEPDSNLPSRIFMPRRASAEDLAGETPVFRSRGAPLMPAKSSLLAARLPCWLFAPRVEVRHAASGMGITTHSGA